MQSDQFTVLTPSTFTAPNNFRMAAVLSVHDGDTIHCAVESGFPGNPLTFGATESGYNRFRMHGINAPEMKTEKGPPSKAHLQKLCITHRCFNKCVLEILGLDNYGRPVAVLYSADGSVNINQQMLADGFAEPLRQM